MTTEEIIRAYYDCWVRSDREGARKKLADDLKFRSPQDDFDSADAFIDTCWKFAEGFDSMEIVHQAFEESAGYIAYRGAGFSCGEFIRLREGLISEIYVTFEPTL